MTVQQLPGAGSGVAPILGEQKQEVMQSEESNHTAEDCNQSSIFTEMEQSHRKRCSDYKLNFSHLKEYEYDSEDKLERIKKIEAQALRLVNEESHREVDRLQESQ